jgi:hypothetical protein
LHLCSAEILTHQARKTAQKQARFEQVLGTF